MPKCLVTGCSNYAWTKYQKFGFFAIPDPKKDPQRCRIWLERLGIDEFRYETYEFSRHRVVCEQHFEADCIGNVRVVASKQGFSFLKRLKPGSVPTLLLPSPQKETGQRGEVQRRQDPHQLGETITTPTDMEDDSGGWLVDDSPAPSPQDKGTGEAATKPPTKPRIMELGFKFTCLEKMQKLMVINYEDLRQKGLGIPGSEMVDGRRRTTKIPSNWTMDQLRQMVLELFPRLNTFRMYRGVQNSGLAPISATTVRALKKEIHCSCVYIVPTTPLAPLEVGEPDQTDTAEEEVTTIDSRSPSPPSVPSEGASQPESLRSNSPSVCEVDNSPIPSESSTVDQPEPAKVRDPQTTCVVRNCSDHRRSRDEDDDSLALHKFPADEDTARKWVNFVRYTRRDYDPSPSSDRICSRHFHSDSYEGIVNEHLYGTQELYRLRPDAVPTIIYALEPDEGGAFPLERIGPEARGGGKSMATATHPKDKLHYVKLTEINAYITCFLCGGYMFNATTITECLHSFCKKCILQHFQKDNKCPTCDVLVHESIPFHFIRPDGLLQMIINKLLPNFESMEKEAERKIQDDLPARPASPVPLLPTAETVPIYAKTVSHTQISLQLEYMGASSDCPPVTPLEKNFVRVSSMATIRHVQKFISHKLSLGEEFEVDIICGEEILQPAVVLYNLKREVEKEQIIDNILVLSYSLGLAQ